MAKNSPKKNKTEPEVPVEFTIPEELLIQESIEVNIPPIEGDLSNGEKIWKLEELKEHIGVSDDQITLLKIEEPSKVVEVNSEEKHKSFLATQGQPTKGKTKKLGLDLEWVSEFETSTGAKFNRFEPADFNRFSKHTYFDNLTSPFSSYSYTLVGSKFHNPKIVLSLDQNGLWFYVSYKENENSDSKTKLTKLTHSYEDALIFLNTLPLEVSKDVLVDLEILN